MSVVSSGNTPPIFDLKSATLTLVAVQLKTTDIGVLRREFAKRYGNDPQVFENDPVVIDLSLVESDPTPIDFPALVVLLQSVRMQPIAVKAGSAAQMEAALEAGLTEAPASAAPAPVRVETQVREVIHEVIREVAVPGPVVSTTALLVDRPLRSGQQVYAKDADLVVLAMVNPGAGDRLAAQRRRSHRRRQHPRVRAAARQGDRRRPRQHRRPHLHHVAGGRAALHRRHLPNLRSPDSRRVARQARADPPRRREARDGADQGFMNNPTTQSRTRN
jgi:septum site-determining protein MinC